jgi:hypothetical protein
MSDALFRAKAPGIMNLLMADFALDVESAAAILGNLGHESGGFQFLQEKQPLIPGSAGGYGWAQWTGPRRRAYESYVERNNLDPASDTANYKYLFLELKGLEGDEARAIPAVKSAVGLREKVIAFELAFERAHKDHKGYDSRVAWATKALEAYRANPHGTIDVQDGGNQAAPVPVPSAPQLPALKTNLDINALLPLILGVLTMLQNKQQEATGKTPDILELLTGILQQGVPKPVDPPAPTPVVQKPSVQLSIGALVASVLGMATGAVGTPFGMGPEPTTTGTLSVLAPIGSALIGMTGGWGMLAKLGIGLVGGLAGRLSNKAKPS